MIDALAAIRDNHLDVESFTYDELKALRDDLALIGRRALQFSLDADRELIRAHMEDLYDPDPTGEDCS